MHLLLLKQKSHTTDFFCPPLRNLINASALQSFPSLSPFFAPHSLRLLFHLSFFPSLYNPFFHTQSQNMASAHFFFPSFAYSLFHTPAFSRVLYIHFFFRCRKCFLLPSASPLSASCLSYPVFPIFFLLCLSASVLRDSFLPFLQQKHIR